MAEGGRDVIRPVQSGCVVTGFRPGRRPQRLWHDTVMREEGRTATPVWRFYVQALRKRDLAGAAG